MREVYEIVYVGDTIHTWTLILSSFASPTLYVLNTRIPLQRYRLAVYDRRPGESRVHWISFGITVLVEIGSRKDSSVVASNDNKTGVKRRHY